MKELSRLTSCVYEQLLNLLDDLWLRYKTFTCLQDDINDCNSGAAPSVLIGNKDTVLVKLAAHNNDCIQVAQSGSGTIKRGHSEDDVLVENDKNGTETDDDRLLVSTLPCLTQLLFPVS